ncbi:MAG: ASPIC/UnbV domain-containing protein [Phycisphaerales bacterium]
MSCLSGFDYYDDGRGVAVVDWDGDGDNDLWLRNRTGPQIRFMRNNSSRDHHFLSVTLVGSRSNRDAIGAKVTVETGDGSIVSDTVRAGTSFQMQSSKTLTFGLGDAESIRSLTIRWPSGRVSRYEDVAVDQHMRIVEGSNNIESRPSPVVPALAAGRIDTEHPTAVNDVALVYRVPIPDIGGETFSGTPLSVRGYRGSPVVVTFWASWCAPCIAELQEWGRAAGEGGDKALRVMALSVDTPQDRSKAESLASQMDLPFDVGMADETWMPLMDALQHVVIDMQDQFSLPTTLLIDSDGEIARIFRGPVPYERLKEEARLLVYGDDRVVSAAAVYPGRIDALWPQHGRAIRLLTLAQLTLAEKQVDLSLLYTESLLTQLARYEPMISTWMRTASHCQQLAVQLNELGRDGSEWASHADGLAGRSAREYGGLIRRDIFDEKVWFGLGESLDTISDPRVAEEIASVVIQSISPRRDVAGNRQLGRAIFNLGRWADAKPYLQRTLELDPEDWNSMYRLGTCMLRLGDEAGIEHVTQALAALPPHAGAEFIFAQDLESIGRNDLALEHYRKSLAIDPTFQPSIEAAERLSQ